MLHRWSPMWNILFRFNAKSHLNLKLLFVIQACCSWWNSGGSPDCSAVSLIILVMYALLLSHCNACEWCFQHSAWVHRVHCTTCTLPQVPPTIFPPQHTLCKPPLPKRLFPPPWSLEPQPNTPKAYIKHHCTAPQRDLKMYICAWSNQYCNSMQMS